MNKFIDGYLEHTRIGGSAAQDKWMKKVGKSMMRIRQAKHRLKYTTPVAGEVSSSYDGLTSTSHFKAGCAWAHEVFSGAAHRDA